MNTMITKIIKLLVLVVGSGVFLFVGAYAGYTYLFQQIINEGSILADNQCLYVNPLIIQRKNSYIKSTSIIMAKGDPKAYWDEQKQYIAISKKYIAAQQNWLTKQKEFMNRWDFRLILPQYVKDAGKYQYLSREAEMKGTAALIEMFESSGDEKKQKALAEVVIEENKKADAANKAYGELWKTAPSSDIRTRFIQIPKTKCSPENLYIPKTEDLFKPIVPPSKQDDGPVS